MCLFPKKVPIKVQDRIVWTMCRCGKCIECLNFRIHDWEFRCKVEKRFSRLGLFVTLTYDDRFLPPNGVDVPTLQKFIKRVRKQGLVFSYYALGEYGTKETGTHRPHYHLLMFIKSNHTYKECDRIIRLSWQYGFIVNKYMNFGNIHYTISYLTTLYTPVGKNKPFSVMSKRPAIGSQILDDSTFVQMLQENDFAYVFRNGRKVHCPRYYKKKLNDVPYQLIDVYLKMNCSLCLKEYKRKLEYSKTHKVPRSFFNPYMTKSWKPDYLVIPPELHDFYHWDYNDKVNKDKTLKNRNKKLRIL